MPDRKKVLALMIHLPREIRERLGELRKMLKLECLSDVIILAVDQYYDELMGDDDDDTE